MYGNNSNNELFDPYNAMPIMCSAYLAVYDGQNQKTYNVTSLSLYEERIICKAYNKETIPDTNDNAEPTNGLLILLSNEGKKRMSTVISVEYHTKCESSGTDIDKIKIDVGDAVRGDSLPKSGQSLRISIHTFIR